MMITIVDKFNVRNKVYFQLKMLSFIIDTENHIISELQEKLTSVRQGTLVKFNDFQILYVISSKNIQKLEKIFDISSTQGLFQLQVLALMV